MRSSLLRSAQLRGTMKFVRASENSPSQRRPCSLRSSPTKRAALFVLCAFGLVVGFHLWIEPSIKARGAATLPIARDVPGNVRRLNEQRSTDLKYYCRKLESSTGKRVLVTGSVGFIGYHLAAALRRRGDGVIGYDNFNDYYPVTLKHDRAHVLEDIGVYTVVGELTNEELLVAILNRCQITHVVHMAAQAGVRYAKEHPMRYVESNIRGSVALFEAARQADSPPAIVYASSSSVYGSNTLVPFSESDAVDHPTSLYGVTKRSVELTAGVYHNLYSLSFTGLRFFTVYGPSGRPDMACFQFARAILLQEPIKIFQAPDGTELGRDFTYVDDIVDGISGALDITPKSTTATAHNEIYNLGNTSPVTVSEFVHSLERAMGQETVKERVTVDNTGDVLFTHANVTKALQSFNFVPSVSLDEGLDRFANWFTKYSQIMPSELWTYPNGKP